MGKPIVRIVDDEESVRSAERFVLGMIGLDVACYESAEAFLEKDDFGRPGCVVLDIRMDGMSGLELQSEMNARGVELPILFLSGHGDINMAVLALKRGAFDFLEKPVRPEKLQKKVRTLVDFSVAQRKARAEIEKKRRLFAMLTPRELTVVRLVATGAANKVIGAELNLAEQSVKIYRGRICRKLNVRTAVDVARFLKAIGEAPSEAGKALGGGLSTGVFLDE